MSNTSEQDVFLKSGLAHTIAGFFTWAALFITCHQVSRQKGFFRNLVHFRYTNIFVGTRALPNKDGSCEYYLSSRFMLSTPGLVFFSSPTTFMSTSILSEIATKRLSSTVSFPFATNTLEEKATSWLKFEESLFVLLTTLL